MVIASGIIHQSFTHDIRDALASALNEMIEMFAFLFADSYGNHIVSGI